MTRVLEAVDLIANQGIGRIVSLRGNEIGSVTIKEACGKLKLVEPNSELVRVARAIGVEMGA